MDHAFSRCAGRALVLAACAVSACADTADPDPLGPQGAEARRVYDPYVIDPEINQGDTHYVMEIVQEGSTAYTSPEPITDPATGTTSHDLTVQHETENQVVQAGYDASYRTIHVLDETTPQHDPTLRAVNTTRRTRSVDDALARYGAGGQWLPDDPAPVEPMRTANPSYEQITDGVVLDARALDTLAVLTIAAEPVARAAGPRASVSRTAPDEIQIVNQLDDPAPRSASAPPGVLPPARGEHVRTYRRRGQTYVLEEVRLTAERDGANGGTVREYSLQKIRFVRLHENPARDRERRQRRARVPATSVPQSPLSYGEDNVVCPMSGDCVPPDDPPPPPPTSPTCGGPVQGAPEVVFQHGIFSSGATWWRMDEWARCRFATGRHVRPDLNWFRAIDAQRDELRSELPGDLQPGAILIGHSNGGLVLRSFAQWAQLNSPGLVQGVVTLDSPNQGAVIALNVKAAEYLLGGTVLGTSSWIAFDMGWHPFYDDDIPGSAFLLRTNAFNESFQRAGVQTHTPKRWVAWRILKTPSSCNPESGCGERAMAKHTQEVYDRHRHYSKFWYRPWQCLPALVNMEAMNAADGLWHALTTLPFHPSDGFIHGQGQVYPRALRNDLIRNGDSHVGVTRSPFVQETLEEILLDPRLFSLSLR